MTANQTRIRSLYRRGFLPKEISGMLGVDLLIVGYAIRLPQPKAAE